MKNSDQKSGEATSKLVCIRHKSGEHLPSIREHLHNFVVMDIRELHFQFWPHILGLQSLINAKEGNSITNPILQVTRAYWFCGGTENLQKQVVRRAHSLGLVGVRVGLPFPLGFGLVTTGGIFLGGKKKL